jgi:modulator of FtsH protease HflK
MNTISERWTRAIAWLNEAGGPWGKGGGGGDSGGGSGGGGDPKNPWSQPPGGGRRPRGPNGPSALDELLRQLSQLFGGKMPTGGNPGTWKKVLIAVGLVWLALGSFTRVTPEEQGVVTIFGKYAFTLNPGISMTPPWPISAVEKVNVKANNKIDFTGEKDGQNFILTADQNVIDLDYQVRWNVGIAKNYLFQLSDTDTTIREVGESAMREVLGNLKFTDATGSARGLIEQRVALRMQQLLDDYKSGVRIQGVSIMKAQQPSQVSDAFNEVAAAQQNRQTSINNARSYAQQIQAIAEGEASAFDRVYAQYKLAPEVTRRRMYYETMEEILARSDKTIVEPNGVAPYLPIGKGRPVPAPSVEETGK